MDEIRDTFRSSFGGWLWGTAAGLGTLLIGIAGIVLTVAAAGDWGAWPLALTGLALLILLARWWQVMSSQYQVTA